MTQQHRPAIFTEEFITPQVLAKKLELPLDSVMDELKAELGSFADKITPDFPLAPDTVERACFRHNREFIDIPPQLTKDLQYGEGISEKLAKFYEETANKPETHPEIAVVLREKAEEQKTFAASVRDALKIVVALQATIPKPKGDDKEI